MADNIQDDFETTYQELKLFGVKHSKIHWLEPILRLPIRN